ncbi:MAG: protease inhibitor I42 family protein [Candidatus Omnitrophica bacterium]|nr:protease inhibitor I42 family protein [Candidatus Omnitrophota bacterium]MDD5236811.1 protease inhibitor I42 family protein [Candidatus Omnitrophota bacterium]MDD5610331.1 protease inhibitor I42 family protein [Candidatus Omnitrophota bacterium]
MHSKNFPNRITGCFLIAISSALLLSTGCRNTYGQAVQKTASTSIEVNLGENAVISLEANHTTGYSWQLTDPIDKDILELVDSKYIASNTGLIGSGGKEVWTFKTLKKGKTEVSLKYTQPWDKNTPPAKETTFIIIVK